MGRSKVRPMLPDLPCNRWMKSDVFDLTTIFFLVMAVAILFKLWSVLGTRTGEERPPYDPYSPQDAANDDKVVPLPGARKPDFEPQSEQEAVQDNSPKGWGSIAEDGTPLAKGLTSIAARDRSFDPNEFLHGARIAYEMIVTAFADGERNQLESLLTPPVFDGFSSVITERESRKETVSSTFIGIDDATLVEAEMNGTDARVTVKFRSKLISATLNETGEVTEGDPKKVREVTDIWTFERDTGAQDPNWRLAATEAAN